MSSLTDIYTFVEKIGSGAFGDVWKVTKRSNNKTYALKLMPYSEKRLKAVKLEMNLFKLKIESKSKCDCNRIVCYYGMGMSKWNRKKMIYTEMDYIKGYDLRQLFNCLSTPLSRPHFLSLFISLLESIVYIHSKGIVHRDIKGENVMFDKKSVYLVDFGFACTPGRSKDMLLDCKGVKGTELYMPSDIDEHYNPGFGVDVFAVGVLMAQFLTNDKYVELDRKTLKEKLDDDFFEVVSMATVSDAKERASAKTILSKLKKIKH